MNSINSVSLLREFGDAWNSHDVDALMHWMTEDCVYYAAAGPDAVGKEYLGSPAVRDAYSRIFERFPNARWEFSDHFVIGTSGISTWRFSGTTIEGVETDVMGCDIFEITNNRIRVKNSFRKNRV